jgi:hypothetical protein
VCCLNFLQRLPRFKVTGTIFPDMPVLLQNNALLFLIIDAKLLSNAPLLPILAVNQLINVPLLLIIAVNQLINTPLLPIIGALLPNIRALLPYGCITSVSVLVMLGKVFLPLIIYALQLIVFDCDAN